MTALGYSIWRIGVVNISNEMIEKRIYSEKNLTKFRDHLRE